MSYLNTSLLGLASFTLSLSGLFCPLCAEDRPEVLPGVFYVDATEENTRPQQARVSSFALDNDASGRNWRFRDGFGFDVTGHNGIYEKNATANNRGDGYRLITTIDELNPGQEYAIYLAYLSEGSWHIRAGFHRHKGMISFTQATPADRVQSLGLTSVEGSNRNQLLGLIGVKEANENGVIRVFVDDVDYSERRSWYDGVAYGPVVDVPEAPPQPARPESSVLIQQDGGWSWFSDPTAAFIHGDLYVGYCKNRAARMAAARYIVETGETFEFIMGDPPAVTRDDHDVPTFTELPDGRILSTYSRHNPDEGWYYRISENKTPTTIEDWSPQRFHNLGYRNTYANTFRLSGEDDIIYTFSRAVGFNPTFCTSTDNGETWSEPVHFIDRSVMRKGKKGRARPYVRYASNNVDRIDMIYTDNHARGEGGTDNSIYHLFIKDGQVSYTDGSLLKSMTDIPLDHNGGERGTVVYQASEEPWGPDDGPNNWIPEGSAWTWDVQYQENGHPVCVFQVQVDDAYTDAPASRYRNDRIYYFYARWDGEQWNRHFIAQGGRGQYWPEDDYGGGVTIDPRHPNVVYISTNAADPFNLSTLTEVPLNPNDERFEIYRGETSDGGKTWNWEAITKNSEGSNLRPFVPENHTYERALVWFYGEYSTFVDYDCDVLGYFVE